MEVDFGYYPISYNKKRNRRRVAGYLSCCCCSFILLLVIGISVGLLVGIGTSIPRTRVTNETNTTTTTTVPLTTTTTTTVPPTTTTELTTTVPTTTTASPTTTTTTELTTTTTTTTTTTVVTTTPTPVCSLDPMGGIPPAPLACYTDKAYVSVTCGTASFGPLSKCQETSLAQMDMLTGEITVVGRMLGNYSVLNLLMGPDNQLYGVGTRIGGCNPPSQPTMFFKVDKTTGVATQLCNTTMFLLSSPSITLGMNSNGTVFFKIGGITFLFTVDLTTCVLTQLGIAGHVTQMGTVYKDIVYESGGWFGTGNLRETPPPYTGGPALVGGSTCFGSIAFASLDAAYGLFPYVNSTNITSFRFFLVPSAAPTTEQFGTLSLEPATLCNRTFDLTIPIDNLNYTVWDVTSPCYYNIAQEGTIPPIAKRDNNFDPMYSIYLLVSNVLFVFDPTAISVMPYMGQGYVGIVFDDIFTFPTTNALYGLKKKDTNDGFYLYTVGVPTSTQLCEHTGGNVKFLYGVDFSGNLWYVGTDNIEYTISIPGCVVTTRSTLIYDNCTSGALVGNQAASGGILDQRFCVNDAGVIYDVSSNATVASVNIVNGTNFGFDLFSYCDTYTLFLFYETNAGGLLFTDIYGNTNITFPFGDPTKKWSATSMLWC